jgi:hypothetical protein
MLGMVSLQMNRTLNCKHETSFAATVELGYNDHGYNEFMAIKNKILRNF